VIARLSRPRPKPIASASTAAWLLLSLLCPTLFGLLALQVAFSGPYVIQGDARQHVFWMQRFTDAELFQGDLIADYFQSVAPPGYTALYQLLARAGLDPLVANKLLPLPLALLTTVYCFKVFLKLLPVPAGALVATVLLNLALWQKGDLLSATPRAFFYPLFLAFLYTLLQRSFAGCVVTIALQGLFYPPAALISVGILALYLWQWRGRRPHLSRDRRAYLFCGAGLAVALATVLPEALEPSRFGPLFTAAEARSLPEFQPLGRTEFFINDPWQFWLTASRSGVLPRPLDPPLLWAGLALPLLLRWRSAVPLAREISPEVALLMRTALASFGLFGLAHLLLFRLYYPSRYTDHSLRVLMALAAASAITLALDAAWRWGSCREGVPPRGRRGIGPMTVALVGLALLSYPAWIWLTSRSFPPTYYRFGRAAAIYEFFQQQPKDILIVSLAPEAQFLPSFAKRSVLVSAEHSFALQVDYHRQIRERATDLLRAQYTQDPMEVGAVIQKYRIDFWLLEHSSFAPHYLADASNTWLRQYQPAAADAAGQLASGWTPALAAMTQRCTVMDANNHVVLDAQCLLEASQQTA
jgi:hypothetical protein